MNFKSYIDTYADHFGVLDISSEKEFGMKYKDKIDEVLKKSGTRNGKFVGYNIDIDRKTISIIQENKIIYLNFDFKILSEKRILK